MNIKG